MDLTDFLSRLEKVRKMGPDRYQACCPAHEDRSPSLAVRGLSDGRLLIHCFGGCSTDAVMGAMGLTFVDLMPPLDHHFAPVRRPFTGDDALRCLSHESIVVALVTADLTAGVAMMDSDLKRLCHAASRISNAVEYVHGLG